MEFLTDHSNSLPLSLSLSIPGLFPVYIQNEIAGFMSILGDSWKMVSEPKDYRVTAHMNLIVCQEPFTRFSRAFST
jgi:hypothetical protein